MIETAAEPAALRAMIAKTAATWEANGETAPYHSVLTTDEFRPERFAENELSFFASGKDDVALLLAVLQRIGRHTESFSRCLEFGCGVGRVTAPLAASFSEVLALDISRPHLELAQKYLAGLGYANVSFLQVTPDDLHPGAGYDLWFSRCVLQHNPPPVTLEILARMFAGLAPGGVAIFLYRPIATAITLRSQTTSPIACRPKTCTCMQRRKNQYWNSPGITAACCLTFAKGFILFTPFK